MPFDILIHINEDSQRGRVIQSMADAQHVTLEQVVEQIIDVGIQAQQGQLPPVEAHKQRTTKRGPSTPLRSNDAETAIGMFADKEGFRESIDTVIASRSERYGFES
jgi:hypothetical protein